MRFCWYGLRCVQSSDRRRTCRAPRPPRASRSRAAAGRRPARRSRKTNPMTAALPRSGCARVEERRDRAERTGTTISLRAVALPCVVAMKEARQHDDERELHELRRLQRERAEVDPAPRAAASVADQRDEHEQAESRRVDRRTRSARACGSRAGAARTSIPRRPSPTPPGARRAGLIWLATGRTSRCTRCVTAASRRWWRRAPAAAASMCCA